MFRRYLKYFVKNNSLVHRLIAYSIFLYLKFVYATSKWSILYQEGAKPQDLKGALFALWHRHLAFGMHVFKYYENVSALASSHTDGKIITDVIKMMKFNVVEGSSNRNPTGAVKSIIKLITTGEKVVITPDGPRGPRLKVNSNITRIAYKYKVPLLPVSCSASKYFQLNSWDRMIIPKPFGEITVILGSPIKLSGNSTEDDQLLETKLITLLKNAKR